tara:strand:+ start:250 stop:435 length:186 start_codon:yes stop_codon:yes gene_type:complete
MKKELLLNKIDQLLRLPHKNLLVSLASNHFPNGFINNISDGSKVKTEIIASNIASPVKMPK